MSRLSDMPADDRLDRTLTAIASALGVVAVLAVLTTVRLMILLGDSLDELLQTSPARNAVLGLAFGLLGALAVADRPRNLLAWLFVLEGLSNALTSLGDRWATYILAGHDLPFGGLAAWLGSYAWIPGFFLAVTALPLLYPTGHLPSPRWRPVGWAVAIVVGVGTLAAFLSPKPMEDAFPQFENPLVVVPEGVTNAVFVVFVPLIAILTLTCLASMVFRWRHAGPRERAQIGWLLLALAINLVLVFLPSALGLELISTALIPVAIGIAVLRYGLFNIERLLNRALVYTVLSAAVVGVFALFAGVLGARAGGSTGGAIVAAVVVALGVGPARTRVQRTVDRLMYGERRDPYTALSVLGRRLEGAVAPDTVMPTVVEAITATLRLPYAAVTLAGDEQPVATAGTPGQVTVDLPLAHAGEAVGILHVGLRRGETALDPADAELLADFARQVGATADTVLLTRDLRRSRERLVAAREEERRRIRRDLHDGLGPALAGLALTVGAARRAADRGGAAAGTLLTRAETDAQSALAEVRRISHDLRPAALDELGLVEALSQHADIVSGASDLVVDVVAEPLPALPAAVEVAAYRIVMEAVTNVSRHAGATTCVVRLGATDTLTLEIADDGCGLPAQRGNGLGLSSMRERATELGGQWTVESSTGAGTTVRVSLPLKVLA